MAVAGSYYSGLGHASGAPGPVDEKARFNSNAAAVVSVECGGLEDLTAVGFTDLGHLVTVKHTGVEYWVQIVNLVDDSEVLLAQFEKERKGVTKIDMAREVVAQFCDRDSADLDESEERTCRYANIHELDASRSLATGKTLEFGGDTFTIEATSPNSKPVDPKGITTEVRLCSRRFGCKQIGTVNSFSAPARYWGFIQSPIEPRIGMVFSHRPEQKSADCEQIKIIGASLVIGFPAAAVAAARRSEVEAQSLLGELVGRDWSNEDCIETDVPRDHFRAIPSNRIHLSIRADGRFELTENSSPKTTDGYSRRFLGEWSFRRNDAPWLVLSINGNFREEGKAEEGDFKFDRAGGGELRLTKVVDLAEAEIRANDYYRACDTGLRDLLERRNGLLIQLDWGPPNDFSWEDVLIGSESKTRSKVRKKKAR